MHAVNMNDVHVQNGVAIRQLGRDGCRLECALHAARADAAAIRVHSASLPPKPNNHAVHTNSIISKWVPFNER